MPNHVTTICTVTGPAADVAAFTERHIISDKEGDPYFAFETIIPKPAILNETESGSESKLGMMALVGDVVHTDFTQFRWIPQHVLDAVPFYHARRVREWLEKENPSALAKGRKCLQAIAETGYPTWYEWSIAKWGTKWGAYDYAERERAHGRFVFKFKTAWSFPEPIFYTLAKLYPSLTLAVISYDECDNFGCDGEFNGRNNYRCMKELATDEMYERVYGHKPERDEN